MDPLAHDADDAPPTDFLAHLQQRLGLERREAENLLARWMKDYRPVRPERRARAHGEMVGQVDGRWAMQRLNPVGL